MLHAATHRADRFYDDIDGLLAALFEHDRYRKAVAFFERFVQADKHDVVATGFEFHFAAGRNLDPAGDLAHPHNAVIVQMGVQAVQARFLS